MELPAIPEEVKELWEVWNLRGCIMLSLFLQLFLVLLASSRQRCRSSFFLFLIWAAYVLADWVAKVAIGLITQSQGNAVSSTTTSCSCDGHNRKGTFDQDIYAFWASFLLLHLGGPDAITSFALEDNELWIRSIFELFLQALAAFYCFYLTLPENKLWLPTLLVFFAGIIKNAERIRSLYLASLDHFGRTALPKPEPGLDYEEASSIYFSNLLKVPIQEEMTDDQKPNSSTRGGTSHDPYIELDRSIDSGVLSDEMKQLRAARVLFERFKGLIVGFLLTSKDRKCSQDYFLKLTDHKWAFRVIEYELSFMFQVLHTKVVVVHRLIGYIFRFISVLSILGAAIYYLFAEKHGYGRHEIILTYALLTGAIALDIISLIVLFFSDWTLVHFNDEWIKYVPPRILKRRRWSRLVSQYNMINSCLDECPTWLYNFCERIDNRKFLENIKITLFSLSNEVTERLQEFIFDYLKEKSNEAGDLREATEACLQRGGWNLWQKTIKSDVASYLKLKWSVEDFQYEETLLLWHIATELCCHEKKDRKKYRDFISHLVPSCIRKLIEYSSKEKKDEKKNCKVLSDYMFYLLIAQPTMLSPVLGDWHVVFQDTCAEAKRFFKKYSISHPSEALEKMKSAKTKFRAAAVKGAKSKSVFFDACILAHQLTNLKSGQWEIMDRVWVEFMSYAAINCRPIVHAQQLSRGGELLTFTWLLMNHFGLGTQFSEQEEKPAMKMAAVK